jgi:hypothetical protein
MRIKYSAALFFSAVWITMGVARADGRLALNAQPGNDAGAKPPDRSCYVRDEDGNIRYYLEAPLRDGELLWLQGQPVIGADGKLVARDDVPQSAIPPRILRSPPCPAGHGSLKPRGAVNALLALSSAWPPRGIVAASGGNHGLAVAYAG